MREEALEWWKGVAYPKKFHYIQLLYNYLGISPVILPGPDRLTDEDIISLYLFYFLTEVSHPPQGRKIIVSTWGTAWHIREP